MILSLDNIVKDEKGIELMKLFNLIFTIVFTVELGIKLFALGLKGYIKDPMNIFDCIIVIISWCELIFFEDTYNVSAFRSVRIFRAFRVLRMTKLIKSL